METKLQTRQDLRTSFHFKRRRLNQLLSEAVRYPVVLVCAGAGYGKTSALHDFLEDYEAITVWIQLSERDNIGVRFWENFIHSMNHVNLAFADAISKFSFPDTLDKINQYLTTIKKYIPPLEKRILVLDDVHILEDPLVIRFAERGIQNLMMGTTIVFISRSTPRINLTGLASKDRVFYIGESDLRFTENELANYFRCLDIFPGAENLREIMQDTDGWAFAINLIARSYQKAPAYGGYLRSAMKTNIFQVMETGIWHELSERVQRFLVRLSLIGHLSFDLIKLLAGEEEGLIDELERQNAYVSRDSYINAYLIHPLFLEFLAGKQHFLSEDEKRETYAIAGEWCNKNGFKIDALSYFEKIGDYASIVSIFYALPAQLPYDIAKYAVTILDRTPAEKFDTVAFLAIAHLRCYMRLGLWQRATELVKHYEEKYLRLPEDDDFRKRNLAGLYFLWAYLRNFMCLNDNVFDFDRYFAKFCETYPNPSSLNTYPIRSRIVGPWINANGSPKKGAPEEYIIAVSRVTAFLPQRFGGFMAGEEDIIRGELKFFQGDMPAAEAFIAQGLIKAGEHRQFEIQHRALLYTLRLSIAQGNYANAELALKEMKAQLHEEEYPNRYTNYDIALSVYYFALGLLEKIPDWVRQGIAPYSHVSFIENFENLAKVRYCYVTRNYPPLLAYIQEMKQRESYLYGRVVMLAIEACTHYKMKDRAKALASLEEAYEAASPNGLIMPFIEMGKDMRTLTSSALKEPGLKVPKAWLEGINRKAASYAKRQAQVALKYKQVNRITGGVVLSPREADILQDLSHGLSRVEIADNRSLSINTVKMVINGIYSKMGAGNIADLIRIAVEQKMV